VRIAFVCQYFVPEIGAPSARVSELCREWVAQGHQVTVVTALPNHPTGIIPPEYRGVWFRRETLDGITVFRNWLYATPNEGFVKRTMSHLTFMCSAAVFSTPRLSGHDVIVVSSPAFFAVLTAWFMSKVWRIPFVFEVRDLWPGIFIELGILKNRAIIGILEAVEMFLYRQAAHVVVVTEAFRDILIRRGVPAEKASVITNGVDMETYRPAPHETDLRRAHGLDGRFVALYIGAHGISQALSAILAAAQLLADDPEIAIVFVGEGAEKKMLVEKAAALGLGNVRFLPGQPKALMPEWYATADAVFVPLRNIPMFETFIPSKMFEILASGRPIVGSVKGEARGILERSDGAIVVDPEDAPAIAAAVRRLKADPALRTALAEKGVRFVGLHYDRRMLARQYLALLERLRRHTAERPTG
jgi:glycosyltransferase involved in cell wall biosynthesis